MKRASWRECAIDEVAADEPNAICIGPFGSDLLASDLVGSGVPVVFVRNVRPGRFEAEAMRYVTPAKAERLRSHRVRGGDIVITKMGLPPCVAAAYPTDAPDGIITADIIKLTPDLRRVDPRYLVYFLNSTLARSQVARFTFGVTRPKVTLKDFRTLRLHLPPLDEQHRIADILDKADAIRRKRKEAIALTEELLRSTFLEMFGDPVTNPKRLKAAQLKEVIVIPLRNGLSPASAGTYEGTVLTLSAITRGRFDPSSARSAAFAHEPSPDVCVDERDFLICRGNGNRDLVGVGAFPTGSRPDVVFPDTMIAARVDQRRVGRHYLEALWKSRLLRSHVEASARTTNGTFKINQTVVESAPVLLPPSSALAEFEALATHLEALREHHQVAEARAMELFSSLVDRSFRGEPLRDGRMEAAC